MSDTRRHCTRHCTCHRTRRRGLLPARLRVAALAAGGAGVLLAGCATTGTADRRAVQVAPPSDPDAPDAREAPAPAAADLASVRPWPLRHRGAAGEGPRVDPQVAWTLSLPGPVTAALTTDRTAFFAVAGGTVTCVSRSGELLWQVAADAVGPVVPGGSERYVGAKDGALLGLGASDGRTLLAFPAEREARVRGSAVPLGKGLAWATVDGRLHHTAGWSQGVALTVATDLASDGERVYLGTLDGALHGVSAPAEGEDRGEGWKARVPAPVATQPVVLGGVVVVGHLADADGNPGLAAFRRDTGRPAWRIPLVADPAGDLAVVDSAAEDGAGDGAPLLLLVPRTDGVLEAVDVEARTTAWEAPLGPDAVVGAPVVAGRSAYVGDAGGRVHRVDLDDGGVAWTEDLGPSVTGDPVLLDGRLVVGLADGRLVALAEAR